MLLAAFVAAQSDAAGAVREQVACNLNLAKTFPKRNGRSESGSSFVKAIRPVTGTRRDELVTREVLDGNIPGFIRALTPVTLSGKLGSETIDVTICVTPDYLSVGDDRDFVRVPVGLPAAARIASGLGFFLPTTKMVDAIYLQAAVKLAPQPMPPTSQMQSTDYFWAHNRTVDDGRARAAGALGDLTAGQKKDIVLTNRLRSKPGRVAIYGWHRQNGRPIQPLSTVHDAGYADYSHGLRLVSSTAFVNGQPRSLGDILQDPQLSQIVSSEGPIPEPNALLRSFR
ncbi:hypothetical protein [Ovoidimarina sediminis]|uniref:hypothetical protein n=1 Tax=Ovoidimarina sediminis TaxID=3079856 RepID=UPI002913CC4E|nr:hypothetical protein [Rhodophyticola sp. MJ-SS7]MDU8945793.1 hypothetical protein [Rhodophyticola sp. MJ-SS7]